MNKKTIKKSLDVWNCLGRFGYGQGRAVAEFGEDAVGDTAVCFELCPKSQKCREKHAKVMDERFPGVAEIVKKTVATATQTGINPVSLVVSAMRVAVKRENPEAMRIQEGLKRFGVSGSDITDHYVYGQLENVDNGINKRDPETKPTFILIGASI